MSEGKTISTKQKDSSKTRHLVAVLFFWLANQPLIATNLFPLAVSSTSHCVQRSVVHPGHLRIINRFLRIALFPQAVLLSPGFLALVVSAEGERCVLQEFAFPSMHHVGVEIMLGTDDVELFVPLQDGKDNLAFEFR